MSSVTGDLGKTVRLGTEMGLMVLRMRLKRKQLQRAAALTPAVADRGA